MLLLQELPNTQRFRDTPCLGVAAALSVRRVAIDDFRQLANAAFLQQTVHAAKISFGCRDGFCREIPGSDESFAKHRKGPGPCCPVMVGGFAARIFIAFVAPPIGRGRIIEQPIVIPVIGQWNCDTQWRQSAKRAGNHEVAQSGFNATASTSSTYDAQAWQK